jgi:E3 ubiquitin-protein ligase UBR4
LTSANDQQSGASDSCIAEDDITCSEIDDDEEDEEDEDSEPILGKWFADTLFPPEEETANETAADGSENAKSSNKRDGSDASVALLVPQKGEPAGFVSLANQVFVFLNKHIVNCESRFVRNYIRSGLTEQQVNHA